MSGPLVTVALPLPFQAPFTYRLPEGEAVPERGVRVLVPFGSRRVIGVVTGPAAARAGLALKDVIEVLDESPLVAPAAPRSRGLDGRALPRRAWRVLPAGDAAGGRPGEPGGGATRPAGSGERGRDRGRAPRAARCRSRPSRDGSARTPRRGSRGCAERGSWRSTRTCVPPVFDELQVAVLLDVTAAPKGAAQAEVLERLRKADGRARSADLVRDRPALRSALVRLAALGVVRLETEHDVRAPETLAGGLATALDPFAGPGASPRPPPRGGARGRLRALPPPRRHRQRQDRGLLPGRRAGPRARARGPPPRARDRPHADARARSHRALRGDGRGPAQRAVGRGAARPVVAHPGGGGAGRGRGALRASSPRSPTSA